MERTEGRCDCGAVTITLPALPDEMNACPCSYCTRVGAHWGYFAAGTVEVQGSSVPYRRAAKRIEFHHCPTCGITTHWIDPDGRVKHMGANMRNFAPEVTKDIPVVIDP